MGKFFVLFGIFLVMGFIFFYKILIDIIVLYIFTFIFLSILFVSILFEKRYRIYFFILSFLIGGITLNISLNSSILDKYSEQYVNIKGSISEEIEGSTYYLRYIVDVVELYFNHEKILINERMLIYVNRDEKLSIGDNIKFEGIINIPKSNTNKSLFNYRLYLQSKKIYSTMTIHENDIIVESAGNISKFKYLRQKFRVKCISIIDNSLSEKNSSIMKGIIFGEDSYLDDDTLNMFRELGLSHILAVSGLHIGIISGFILLFLSLFAIDRKFKILLSLLIVWIYGYIINYPISVLRALVMFSLLAISNIYYKKYDPLNILFFSLVVLLFINPLWIFTVSFQLSFVAVFSLVVFTKKIQTILKINNNKIKRIISPLLSIQIGLIPIISYYFNSISIISILSNLIIIPIMSFIIILNFILIISGFISIHISKVLGYILGFSLDITQGIATFIHNHLNLYFKITSFSFTEIIIYYIIIFIVLKIININFFNIKIKKLIFMYTIILILSSNITNYFDETSIIQFIDVGQGDSTLVEYKNNTFLIDTGGSKNSNFDVGENILIPYLLKNKISKLNTIFISHFDYDHVGTLPNIIKNIDIDKLFAGYINLDKELSKNIVYFSHDKNIPLELLNSGDEIIIDKNFKITVLNPPRDQRGDLSDNNLSLVLLFEIYNNKILFTGDIEEDIEKKIIKKYDIEADVIKVAHHGSKTSSSVEFIEAIKPKYAVISVGKNNYNHPNYEVVDRYVSKDVKIFRTDKDGLITLEINKNNFRIYPYTNEKIIFGIMISKYFDIIIYNILYLIISIFLIRSYSKTIENAIEVK